MMKKVLQAASLSKPQEKKGSGGGVAVKQWSNPIGADGKVVKGRPRNEWKGGITKPRSRKKTPILLEVERLKRGRKRKVVEVDVEEEGPAAKRPNNAVAGPSTVVAEPKSKPPKPPVALKRGKVIPRKGAPPKPKSAPAPTPAPTVTTPTTGSSSGTEQAPVRLATYPTIPAMAAQVSRANGVHPGPPLQLSMTPDLAPIFSAPPPPAQRNGRDRHAQRRLLSAPHRTPRRMERPKRQRTSRNFLRPTNFRHSRPNNGRPQAHQGTQNYVTGSPWGSEETDYNLLPSEHSWDRRSSVLGPAPEPWSNDTE